MRALGSRRRARLRGNTAAAFAAAATLGKVVYALDKHPKGRVQEAARLQFKHQLGMGSASVAISGSGSATSKPSRSAMDAGWVCAWEFLRFPHRNRFVQIIHAWPRPLGHARNGPVPLGRYGSRALALALDSHASLSEVVVSSQAHPEGSV